MNSKRIYFGILLIVIFSFGCKNNESKKPQDQSFDLLTAIDLDERLKTADSLVLVFYKDPYGDDSLRYTRYYTQASVTAIKDLIVLQQELTQPFSRHEIRRNCRGEGKIWCFTKGKIFQTLYFSTRCDNCCYFYFIKDGIFYYSKILPSTTEWLKDVKLLSTEPENKGKIDE